MKITIATPHKNNFTPEYVTRLAFMLRRAPKDWELELFMRDTGNLFVERNNMFRHAQKRGCDYLLFIDTDMSFPLDGLARLIKTSQAYNCPVVCGLAIMRNQPFLPAVYHMDDKFMVHNITSIPSRPFEIDACGGAFTLISKEILDLFTPEVVKEWGQPFNIANIPDHPKSFQLGEDVSFCLRLKMMGKKIMCDPSVYCGHVGKRIYYLEEFPTAAKEDVEAVVDTRNGVDGFRGYGPASISVMFPSRNRPTQLAAALRSLVGTASSPERLEFIVRYDDDDEETGKALVELSAEMPVLALKGGRLGYVQLNHYYEEMALYAKGKWFLVFNDDALMRTMGWDDVIMEQPPHLLKPAHNHPEAGFNVFPVIPRKMYAVLGYFGLSSHVDTWFWELCRPLGLEKAIDVEIFHDRADLTGNNDDEVYRAREYTQDHMWSEAMIEVRGREIEKLRRAYGIERKEG